ncbi:MAG TPA: VWA domain-containing protein [Blastocatellia bacterium]|nr:VWA domain-containing protein [Blastocatellia bacterium]
MHKSLVISVIVWLALCGQGLSISAQTSKGSPKKAPESPESGEAIAIETSEVLLPVTVRDSSGQFITDLKAEDFTVLEDGKAQPISSFALKRIPVHVVLLIDTSSSVKGEIEDFKTSAWRFISRLDPEDEVSLIRFDDVVELVQDWTKNRSALKRALNRLGGGMFTRFNDALYLAASEQLGKVKGRKAIIVLTDGIDSGRGAITQEQAFRSLIEEEVPVYCVSKTVIQGQAEQNELSYYLKSAHGSINQLRVDAIKMTIAQLQASERNLLRITEETGGRLFLPKSFDDLDQAYQQVADELRNQYIIFYTPTNTAQDGSYRAVRVKVNQPNCHVTTRFGYYSK